MVCLRVRVRTEVMILVLPFESCATASCRQPCVFHPLTAWQQASDTTREGCWNYGRGSQATNCWVSVVERAVFSWTRRAVVSTWQSVGQRDPVRIKPLYFAHSFCNFSRRNSFDHPCPRECHLDGPCTVIVVDRQGTLHAIASGERTCADTSIQPFTLMI